MKHGEQWVCHYIASSDKSAVSTNVSRPIGSIYLEYDLTKTKHRMN
jgi:hypothetical protein